jgi:hypothetical protein
MAPITAGRDDPADAERRSSTNQTTMIGPNSRRRGACRTAGRRTATRMTTEIGRRTVEARRRDLQTFRRAEHADGRRDHAVAVEQRRAEDAEPIETADICAACLPARRQQRGERRMPPSPWLSARITIAMYLTR